MQALGCPAPEDHRPLLRSVEGGRSTLPIQRTSLVGRGDELDRLGGALVQHRLVNLLGPAGVGKTRTATEAARRSSALFPDGVFFVDLTTVADEAGVVTAFVDGISRATPPERSARDHLAGELAERRVLLVVDNCEHVVDGAAGLIDDLLGAVSQLHVLTTSRVVLDLEDEHVMVLPPLGDGSADSPAVRLFIERALAVDGSFTFDDVEVATIGEIVEHLDGMPLAIELAAARLRTLTPRQILEHLRDRFRLLVGHPRSERRQRSLEQAISWSYDLLDHEEQRTLRTLSVCGGAVSLPTVARLLSCDRLTAADRIQSLTSKSLLTVVGTGGDLRGYRMLESVREFARARLSERCEVDDARLALESALVPPSAEIAADHLAFVNDHIVWSELTTLEASVRRDAGSSALRVGRLIPAAHLLASATSPAEPGGHRRILDDLRDLQARSDELDVAARRSVLAAKMLLEIFTGSQAAAVSTAAEALADLTADDPWRRLPQAVQMLIFIAVDVDHVIAETEWLLPRAVEQAGHPPDFPVALLALTRAIALHWGPARVDEAAAAARMAIQWAAPGVVHEFAMATLLFVEYIAGADHGPELAGGLAARIVENGLPVLPVAATLASDASIEERGSRLTTLARRRPLGRILHEESSYLVAFAWLALEEGDLDRAETLLDAFAPVEPATGFAGFEAMRRLHVQRTGTKPRRTSLTERFMVPGLHERLASLEPATLAAELAYWDRRLTPSPRPNSPPSGARMEENADGVEVLGPLRVHLGGAPVAVTAPKQRAVLTTLALRAGRAVPIDVLVEAVWGDRQPANAARSLQSQISRLRALMRLGLLEGDSASGFMLALDPSAIDAARFESLRARAPAERPSERARTLRAALELWRGIPAPDLADTSTLRSEVAALVEQHSAVEEDLAAALVEAGRPDEGVALLEVLVAAEPLRERRWALLVHALTDAERTVDALRAYQRARVLLIDHHGIGPGPALRAAEARALRR